MKNSEAFSKYEKMQKKIGWKYELVDGKIYASPFEIFIAYKHYLSALREISANFSVSDIKKEDLDNFVAAWLSAYKDTDEFFGYRQSDIEKRAVVIFNRATCDREKSETIMSGIVRDGCDDILGGVLITKTRKAGFPLMQGLFSVPRFRRKGLATTLLSYVVNRLSSMGFDRLIGYCLLSNEIGRHWYGKMGFEELPDVQIARIRRSYFSQEMDRLKRLNELTQERREYLSSEINKWKKEVNRLENIEKKEGFEAVRPLITE